LFEEGRNARMPKLSDVQKKFLETATSQYRESLPGSPAEEYLASRGFQPGNTAVGKFRLGYVADPLPGHEMYRGMLAIPYLRRSPTPARRGGPGHGSSTPGHGRTRATPGRSRGENLPRFRARGAEPRGWLALGAAPEHAFSPRLSGATSGYLSPRVAATRKL